MSRLYKHSVLGAWLLLFIFISVIFIKAFHTHDEGHCSCVQHVEIIEESCCCCDHSCEADQAEEAEESCKQSEHHTDSEENGKEHQDDCLICHFFISPFINQVQKYIFVSEIELLSQNLPFYESVDLNTVVFSYHLRGPPTFIS